MSLSKGSHELIQEFKQQFDHAKIDSKTHLDFLVKSNLNQIANDDKTSLSDMHKYFDHSMRQKITTYNKEKNLFEFK
jgi:translation initiation factor 2 beta subunit (eIF-2beta)/eIF-5